MEFDGSEAKTVLRRSYPLVIVACCFVFAFVNMGLTSTSFNAFQSALVAVPGVGDVGGSLVVTIRVFVTFLCMFFTNRYYAAIDARVGMLIASGCVVAAFCCYGFFPGLPGFCVGAALAGAAYGLGGMVAVTLVIGRWFKRSEGTALGWASVGSGVATFVMPLIITALIQNFSLSAAFLFDGALALVLAALAGLFLRSSPQKMGLAPVGETSDEKKGSSPGPSADGGVTGAEAAAVKASAAATPTQPARKPLSRTGFRLMILAMVMLGAVSMVSLAYLGILFSTEGFSPDEAALMISVAGICLTGAKLLVGIVCDRLGLMTGTVAFYGFLVAGLALCCLAPVGGLGVAIMGAAMTGLGISLGSTGISLWSLRLSLPEDRLYTVRSFQTAFSFGGFLFNLLPGPLKELTGTYVSAYGILAAMALASALIVIAVCRSARQGRS